MKAKLPQSHMVLLSLAKSRQLFFLSFYIVLNLFCFVSFGNPLHSWMMNRQCTCSDEGDGKAVRYTVYHL
jgi:hypothetical protein